MFCPRCGASNKDTARFCLKCGQPLAAPGAEPPPPTRRRFPWVVLVVVVVVLLPTPTPSTTPTPSPTPAPTCALKAGGDFAPLWRDVGGQLGCPTNQRHQTWSAVERFQRGRMIWREDADRIYVLHDDGRWQDLADIWHEWEPETAGLTPPPGLLEPKRGFGKVWRVELGGAQAAIGWAVEEERGVNSRVQDFERGVMLALEGRVYVFYRDGGSWSQP